MALRMAKRTGCTPFGMLRETGRRKPIDDERIVRTQKLSENSWGHTVKLRRKEDVDAQLLGWLKHAHSLRR